MRGRNIFTQIGKGFAIDPDNRINKFLIIGIIHMVKVEVQNLPACAYDRLEKFFIFVKISRTHSGGNFFLVQGFFILAADSVPLGERRI